MSWRPKDWKNPHTGTPTLVFPRCCIPRERIAYEAGADAMLGALRKIGGCQNDATLRLLEILPTWGKEYNANQKGL